MGKKKFIDKKKAATFALLYKESSEAGEDTAQRVFTRVDNNVDVLPDIFEEDEECSFENDTEPWSYEEMARQTGKSLPDQLRKDLLEMGFPDDGYNYMKHMRAMGGPGHAHFVPTTKRVESLAADVKVYDASKVRVEGTSSDNTSVVDKPVQKAKQIQAPISKLEKRLDSEVTALLNDSDVSDDEVDEEGDGDLEDDFVAIANEGVEVESEARTDVVSRALESEEADIESVASDYEEAELEDDTQSVASAAVTATVQILDEQFQVLTLKEYDDDEFEDEEDPRARGVADISQFDDVLDEFLSAHPDLCGRNPAPKPVAAEHAPEKEPAAEQVDEHVEEDVSEENEPEEELEAVWVDDEDDLGVKWDCESVLTSYSNLDNHPGRIGAPTSTRRVKFGSVVQQNMEQQIRLGGKQKLPIDYIKRKEAETDKEKVSSVAPAPRTKSVVGWESREERKARKAAVKEERRTSRQVKKDLKSLFKDASQKAQVTAAVSMRSIRLA